MGNGFRTTDGASRKNVTTFAEETSGAKSLFKEAAGICSRNKKGA
jgi:hypothetical protein